MIKETLIQGTKKVQGIRHKCICNHCNICIIEPTMHVEVNGHGTFCVPCFVLLFKGYKGEC